MNIICKNCGTSSRYSKKEELEEIDGIIIRHTCACGRCRSSTFFARIGDATWQDGKLVDQNIKEAGVFGA